MPEDPVIDIGPDAEPEDAPTTEQATNMRAALGIPAAITAALDATAVQFGAVQSLSESEKDQAASNLGTLRIIQLLVNNPEGVVAADEGTEARGASGRRWTKVTGGSGDTGWQELVALDSAGNLPLPVKLTDTSDPQPAEGIQAFTNHRVHVGSAENPSYGNLVDGYIHKRLVFTNGGGDPSGSYYVAGDTAEVPDTFMARYKVASGDYGPVQMVLDYEIYVEKDTADDYTCQILWLQSALGAGVTGGPYGDGAAHCLLNFGGAGVLSSRSQGRAVLTPHDSTWGAGHLVWYETLHHAFQSFDNSATPTVARKTTRNTGHFGLLDAALSATPSDDTDYELIPILHFQASSGAPTSDLVVDIYTKWRFLENVSEDPTAY